MKPARKPSTYVGYEVADRLDLLFAVAIALGMRRGEALRLRWDDVDLIDGAMRIAMQLQRIESTAGGRTVGSWRPEDRLRPGIHNPQGTPIEPCNINRTFRYAHCQGRRKHESVCHDLRPSCATLLFAQGVDLQTIKNLLGHSLNRRDKRDLCRRAQGSTT